MSSDPNPRSGWTDVGRPRAEQPQPRRPPGPRGGGLGPAATVALGLYATFVLLGAVIAIIAVTGYLRLAAGLPDPGLLEKIVLPERSVINDRNGAQLASFGQFNRNVVTYDQIPPVLVDATTAIEDHTFWDNAGFDPAGIIGAGIDAIRGRTRGASTITQQLVRQRLLSTDGSAQTDLSADRKIREIVQSIRVTEAYAGVDGKRRIMTAYLNQNYYGNDSYGVAAAAQGYFGKDLKDLTLAEAAILAAIPQAPTTYDLVANADLQCVDPTQDPTACTETQLVVPADSLIVQRRNQVLNLMEQGRTPLTGTTNSAADFEAARQEPVVLVPQIAPTGLAPQFVIQVRKELARRLCGADTATCSVIEKGGLTITTTLDLRLQQIAEKWVKAAAVVPHAKDPKAAAAALGLKYDTWIANLRSKQLWNGSLVAIDYQTGGVVAYVGSADATSNTATKKFQPRFDVVADGWRQPGSAFKPLLYGTGIDAKAITAASMFMDVVTDFGGGYVPTDADGLERGPVRVREALQFSLNLPAVKTMAVVGNSRLTTRAEAMGVNFNGGVNAGLSFALGVEEVHSLDLIRAYGTLANGGQLVDQTTILGVTDKSGAELIADSDRQAPTQAIGAGAAYIVTDILSGNTDPKQNPFWGAFELRDNGKHRPATLKTGTNNDAKDLSAYGYIAPPTEAGRAKGELALAVGAWNGNSDNSLISTSGTPVYSIDVTTHVWQGFMLEATKGWGINAFKAPSGIQRVAVDPWTGLAANPGGPSVSELFLSGTAPAALPAGTTCGAAVLQVAGFEASHDNWMAADLGWLDRAAQGAGVVGGPQHTPTSYFYAPFYTPYGPSWGALGGGTNCASPSPSASIDPCASPLPGESPPAPAGPGTPSEAPSCPAPSDNGSPVPSDNGSPSIGPSEPPSPTPTHHPPPTATPTPEPSPIPSLGSLLPSLLPTAVP